MLDSPLSSPTGPALFDSASYQVNQVNTSAGREYRCLNNGFHFMSVVNDHGALAIRTHPGQDPDGWGTTLYFQPFLAGATLAGTTVGNVSASGGGVSFDVSGSVSGGPSGFGSWSAHLDFWRVADQNQVRGSGSYDINLAQPLGSAGDLNLAKIASNFLESVPLLGGGSGDAGDMQYCRVTGAGSPFTWVPDRDGNHFPVDRARTLTMEVVGRYNNVDTARQGFSPIKAAYKPSLEVTYTDLSGRASMNFGGVFDNAYNSQYKTNNGKLFFLDNVGITPFVPSGAGQSSYRFGFDLLSTPPPGSNVQ